MADRVTIYDNLKESGLNLWDALSRSADEYFSSKPSFSPSQPFDMRHYVDGNYLPPLQDSVQRDVGNAVAKGVLDTVTDPVGYVQDLYYGIADPALSVYENTGASLPYYGNAALQRLQSDDNTEAMNIADKYSANAITSLGLLGLGIADVLPSGKVTKPVKGLLDSTPTGVDKRVPVSREDMGILQRVGDVKPVNDLKVEYDATNLEFPEQKVLKAEDLIDRPYMSGMADTSRGGMETIRSINGVPTNTIMWGGQLYVQNPKTGVWANAGTAATGIRNAAQEASEIAGTRGKPLMLPHQMGSAGSMDFNTAIPVLQVQYSRQVMSPSAKKAFDDRIRKGIVNEKGNWQANSEPLKDWVGIDHPNVIDYMNKLGGQRKVVIKALDDFRDEGALSASQARSIIVEPRQQNPKLGNLFEVGNINLDDPVKGIHPTFPVDVLGDYEGTFKTVPNIHKLNPYNRQGLLFLDDMAQRRKPDGSLMYDLSKETQPPNYNKALNAGVIGKLGQKEIDYLLSIGAIEN
jgi:hypothetical protein